MSKRHKNIAVKDIPSDYIYQGYLWLSDESKPRIIDGSTLDLSLFKSQLPFIIEGNLWAKKEQESIQIRFVDGEYHIVHYDLNGVDTDPLLDENSYMA